MKTTLGTGSIDRSARVARIKRVIIGLVVLAILLPTILCIVLYIRMNRLEKQILELSYQKERVNVITESTFVNAPNKAKPVLNGGVTGQLNIEIMDEENPEGDSILETYDVASAGNDVEDMTIESAEPENDDTALAESEGTNKIPESDEDSSQAVLLKRVYLTFDDGPSSNTGKILDILNEHGVKGTFFVVGRLSDTTTPMYRRIVDEGHAIGMHSYTHKYNEIYSSVDSFVYDLEKIQSLIYEQTGVMPKLYRFPGGSSNRVSKTDISLLAEELKKRDIKYYDWNVVSGDASSRYGLSKEAIYKNCTENALGFEEAVILMHDLPEKATTVEALPGIIEYFQGLGVEILPLDEGVAEMHHMIDITE